MEEVSNRLEELMEYIKNTKEYQMCLSCQEKMSHNAELLSLIEQVKDMQKKYVKSGYSGDIKKELDALEEKLEEIPIYHTYLENLERVNEMIDTVRESLNHYFDHLFEKKDLENF